MEYVSLVSELNYMTQVVIMLYEDPTKDASSDERFHVELHFSPGVNCVIEKDVPEGPGFRPHSRNHEGSASQHQHQELQRQQNSEVDAKGHGDCGEGGDCRNVDQPTEVESLQEDATAPNPDTVVCAFKCSSENVSKIFDAVGNPGHFPDDGSHEIDDNDDGEMEANDTALEEAKGEEESAEITQSDPIAIRITRSKESCLDCGTEPEVRNPSSICPVILSEFQLNSDYFQSYRSSAGSIQHRRTHSLERDRANRTKSFDDTTDEAQKRGR